MATTANSNKTTTKKTTATKKTAEAKSTTETVDYASMIETLMAQLKEQNEQMEALKSQLNSSSNQTQQVVVQSGDKFGTKKFKCVNLMHNPVNIATEQNGKGRVFTFDKYGDSRMVRFDELSDIVSAYPYTMENGLIYIVDQDVVEELGLTEDYKNIYDKSTIDKIIRMREEVDVDLFLGLEENLKESTAMEIAKRINANEKVDYNFLNRIKVEGGLDILQLATDLKANQSTSNDSE